MPAGDLSRNRTVGLRIGKGETLQQIIDSMTAVAEGVLTSRHAPLPGNAAQRLRDSAPGWQYPSAAVPPGARPSTACMLHRQHAS